MGRRALLLDWGKADERRSTSVAGHIEELLLPLLREHRRTGGARRLLPWRNDGDRRRQPHTVERVVTLAAPWHFSSYPEDSRAALQRNVAPFGSRGAAARRAADGGAAGELLVARSARTVRKFAEFGRLDPESAEARRFVELEDWANEGEPLPYPAAKELIEDLFGEDQAARDNG